MKKRRKRKRGRGLKKKPPKRADADFLFFPPHGPFGDASPEQGWGHPLPAGNWQPTGNRRAALAISAGELIPSPRAFLAASLSLFVRPFLLRPFSFSSFLLLPLATFPSSFLISHSIHRTLTLHPHHVGSLWTSGLAPAPAHCKLRHSVHRHPSPTPSCFCITPPTVTANPGCILLLPRSGWTANGMYALVSLNPAPCSNRLGCLMSYHLTLDSSCSPHPSRRPTPPSMTSFRRWAVHC